MARNRQYTKEELKQILVSTFSEYQVKLNPYKLEKLTQVKRRTWERYMKEEIEELNNALEYANKSSSLKLDVPMPNLASTVNLYYGNKEVLIEKLMPYNDLINNLFEKALERDELARKNQEQLIKMKDLQEELKHEKRQAKFYKEQYEQKVVDSTYASKREEGLNKVINLPTNRSGNPKNALNNLSFENDSDLLSESDKSKQLPNKDSIPNKYGNLFDR